MRTMADLLDQTLLYLDRQIELYANSTDNSTNFKLAQSVGSELVTGNNCSLQHRHNIDNVLSDHAQLFLLALYSVTGLLALVGNVCVIVLQLTRVAKCRPRPQLHNIRKYLINLAASDLVIGVLCVPFVYTVFMHGRWIFPPWLCPTVQFAQIAGVFVTANILLLIGVERYLATLHPFSGIYQTLRHKSCLLLSLIWLLGLAYASIPIRHTYVIEYREAFNQELTYFQCTNYVGLDNADRRVMVTLNFALTFALPGVVLTFTYTKILTTLTKRSPSLIRRNCVRSSANSELVIFQQDANNGNCYLMQAMNSNTSGDSNSSSNLYRHRQMNSKTIKITLIVILLYALCWAPIKIFQLLQVYNLISFCTDEHYHRHLLAYLLFHWLAMANSFVNPLVYTFASQHFRKELQQIFASFPGCRDSIE